MNREKLTVARILRELETLPGWSYDGDALHRQYQFGSFDEAISFLQEGAGVARKMDHHPHWCNVYDRVTVTLSTHDAGGVTELDLEMARRMEEVALALT